MSTLEPVPVGADLLGAIYDASLDPRRWHDVAHRIAGLFESQMFGLHRYDLQTGRGSTTVQIGMGDGQRAYAEHYSKLNAWLRAPGAGAVGVGELLVGTRLVGDRQLERTEFHADFLRPRDFFYSMGVTLRRDGAMRASATLVRSRSRGDFSAEEQARLATLGVHLRRALEIEERLAGVTAERRALADALDRLPMGVVLLGPGARVSFANARARLYARARDGFTLGADCLQAATPAVTARLRALLASVACAGSGPGQDAGGWMALPRPSGRRPYALLAGPLGPSHPTDAPPRARAVAIAFVSDPERVPRGVAPALRSLFGLTPAEAVLAAALLAGETLQEHAAARGVGVATLRTHLKSLLGKTRTGRQAELLTVLERSLQVAAHDEQD